MPRSYRSIIVAAVGWLILTGQHEQGWAADHEKGNQQQSAQPTAIPQPPHTPSAKATQYHCYPGSEPWVSCDGIAAKAAVDQARDADEQAATVWWQFGVGVLTLGAAIAAAIFAWRAAFHTKRSADSFINAEDASLIPSFTIDEEDEGDVALSVINVGRTTALIISIEFSNGTSEMLTRSVRDGETKMLMSSVPIDFDKAFQTTVRYQTALRKNASLKIIAELMSDDDGYPWITVLSRETS